MACFATVGYLLEYVGTDGRNGLLMCIDLAGALADAAAGEREGRWCATRISSGRDDVLEGEALRTALAELNAAPPTTAKRAA